MSIRKFIRVVFPVFGLFSIAPQVAWPQGVAPIIYSVTLRKELERYEVVYPEFHFQDSNGSVRFIHREVVATNAPKAFDVKDGVISISAEQQKKGATFTGGWRCGAESYFVTLRAYMLTVSGQKSNEVEYTIHCNGG
jgi:hypothetical protein